VLYIELLRSSVPSSPKLLATRSIEARARQEGRASLYDCIVYKRGSKTREKEKGGTEAPVEAIYNPLVM